MTIKKLTLGIFSICISTIALAQYKPVDQKSSLQFTIQNLGFDVHGSFTGFKGAINFDPQHPEKDNFDVTIDAATVNTDNSLRDEHLKNDSYFDATNHPTIHFVSSKITSVSGGKFNVTGKLTIKNTSKEVSFPFMATPSNNGYLFKGSFKINRKDYDIGGTSTISNELEVNLTVLAQ